MSIFSTPNLTTGLAAQAVSRLSTFTDIPELLRSSWPAHARLLEHADALHLAGFASLSPYAQYLVELVIKDRWTKINRSLLPAADEDALQALMTDCEAVMVGSSAVHFCQPSSSWAPTVVEFTVPSQYFERFCDNLQRLSRGAATHPATDTDAENRAVAGRRVVRSAHATFDILSSAEITSLNPITHFYSTHLMTFVSSTAICVAYPHTFFKRMGVIHPASNHELVARGVHKWAERGYQLVAGVRATQPSGHAESECDPVGHCPAQRRYFGDGQCLTIRFGRNSVLTHRGHFMAPLAWTAGWVIGGQSCGTATCTGDDMPFQSCVVAAAISDLV
ncbi:hypothetical protein EIP86_001409 [Pleurotus ostreatoroseus]|nr:hypothetical protein EIP86_001409 [Pleurotus ostreatoroseus]